MKRTGIGILAAVLIVGVAATAWAVHNRDMVAFTSAVLPAASAYATGNANQCEGDRARLLARYTTNASGANGRAEYKVEIGYDLDTVGTPVWFPYAVCDDAAAGQAVTNDLSEWEAQCYARVWTFNTPAKVSTTMELPVLEFNMYGAKYIRVSAREVGDTTNRGSFSASWVCASTDL